MATTTPTVGAVLPRENGSSFPAGLDGSALPGVAVGPTRRATSVAMRLDRETNLFHLLILGEDNELLMTLGPFQEEDVVAEWRALGANSGLPLKLQLPNGAVMEPYPQLGRVLVGPTRHRRRHGLLTYRRPRFLTRRKTGRFPLRPQVHRETEIAGETR